jgi:hypothetical protein
MFFEGNKIRGAYSKSTYACLEGQSSSSPVQFLPQEFSSLLSVHFFNFGARAVYFFDGHAEKFCFRFDEPFYQPAAGGSVDMHVFSGDSFHIFTVRVGR